jgi:hypothetical protein
MRDQPSQPSSSISIDALIDLVTRFTLASTRVLESVLENSRDQKWGSDSPCPAVRQFHPTRLIIDLQSPPSRNTAPGSHLAMVESTAFFRPPRQGFLTGTPPEARDA